MTAIADFSKILNQKNKETIAVANVWAKVISVDWENKTCDCIGLLDDLEIYDVVLGIGEIVKKPKKDSLVLLGVINGNDANAFLIHAEDTEEISFTTGKSNLTIKVDGFVVKQNNESLKQVLNDLIDELNKIIVIQGNTINVAAMNLIKERLNTILIE